MADVIDMQVHLGRDHWLAQHRPELPHACSAADLECEAATLAAAGHRLVAVAASPFPSTDASGDTNEQLTGVLAIPSIVPGDAAAVARLRGGIGIKLWPYMGGFSLSHLLHDPELLARVRRNRWLVFAHVGNGRESASRPAFAAVQAGPADALAVAAALPDVNFVMAHALRLSRPALERAARMDNVYLDTSGLSSIGRWREGGRDGLFADDAGELAGLTPVEALAFLAESGFAERLLFGTSWPFCAWWGSVPLAEVSWIEHSRLAPRLRAGILHDNARRLLTAHGVS
jgi:hypothetical protein